ncbi:MAG: putative TonB-dependent receptor [Polaribacter sp. SA4-10]|nr:MAG: putative TonB-dependent receptor [Polaribacter sp. SA4-10]
MIKQFCLCLIVCFMFTTTTTIAQNCQYSLKGKISDFHDNSSIIGASLQIVNSNKNTITNFDGSFEFKNLCKGKITIVIKHVACESKTISFIISKDIVKEITLEHHLEELEEVVVKSESKSESTSIEKSIKKDIITNFSDKSLGDALNTLSGVSSLNTGNTIVKPMIHGLHSSRLLIINNNVRMFDQEWGDEHAPNIDMNASDRIDVIKGANSLKFGSDAVGGLIVVRGKKYARKDSLFGSSLMSFNSNGFGGNLNSEIIKSYKSGYYTKVQMSYRRFGDFKAADYSLTNSGLENINASFRLGYNSYLKGFEFYYSQVNNKFAILKSSHIGNVNDLVTAINSLEPRVIKEFSFSIDNPKQSIIHHLGKIEAYKRFQGFGKLTFQYDFQVNRRREFDLRRGDLKNTPVIDLRLVTNSIQSDLQVKPNDNLKLNIGFLGRFQQNNPISTGYRPLIPNFDKFDIGLYTIGNYSLNESTELNAGIRYDFSKIKARKWYNITDWNETYNYDELFPEFETGTIAGVRIFTKPQYTFHNFSTGLGLLKKINDDLSLFINYGLANRVPNPSELFSDGLHHSAARIEKGLLNINKETANKFIVSMERNNNNFGFVISPYFKKINGFIQLIPVGISTTIRGAFPVYEYNQIDAEIYGIDIDLNKKINKRLDYYGSISLLRGKNTSENLPLINMPAANFNNKLMYFNEEFKQLSISITHKTVLQQNRFPDYNFFTLDPVSQQDVFVDISSTPPTYSIFGLNISSAFNEGKLQFELNVENLFNTSYREHLNRLRYFSDELGRNINFKIKINY